MKKQVWAYLHTHWDREWYKDKEDFNIRLCEVFDVVLDELRNQRAPFFYFDGQTVALLDYLKYRPHLIDEIKEFIKSEKLAIGPYFVSADSYLVNFCSMLKNLDIGLEISKEFSQKDHIGYMSDIFGISNSAFEALKLKNIDKALIWRGVNPRKINNNCDFIKNTIKTTWLAQGYFNDFFHQDEINIQGIKIYLDKIAKYSQNSCLLPIGADHLSILKDANEKIAFVNSKLDDYEIILSSPFEYFRHTKYQNITKEQEFLDNSNTYILNGVYSARIGQKIKNNQIQNDLSRLVEPLNFYMGDKYRKNIDEIYKTLIKNHAHDGICGCSLDCVARAVDSRFEKCSCMIQALLKRLKGDFKAKNNIKGKSDDKLGVFNLSNSKIKNVEVKLPYILPFAQVLAVESGFCDELLYDINKIPITEDITNLYTQIVEISPVESFEFNIAKILKPKTKIKITPKSIENDFVKLSVKNGKIELFNKKNSQKFELKITDTKDRGDSYNFAPYQKEKNIEFLGSEIEYKGPIRSSLRLNFKNIVLSAVLENHCDFIKFGCKINNKTKNHKINLVLSLEKNITKTTAQDAFGVVSRKVDPNYNIRNFMPAKRPVELKNNIFAMQNFVCANKIIILTKGLHEYSTYQNELSVCLLRSFGTISNPKNPVRSIPAGPDLKTPEAQCLGQISSEFILSFGDYKKAFKILDNLFKNYFVTDGAYEREISFKLGESTKNTYFYGINKNQKIGYNYEENKISLI